MKQATPGNRTRFSPTLSGPMHLGHVWMAFFNWAWGCDDGVLLRFEDITALHCVGGVTTPQMAVYAQDFIEQLDRFGIPVWKVRWQSEFTEKVIEVAEDVFKFPLSWDIINWRQRLRNWGPTIPNFAGESPLMVQMSRVVADKEDDIQLVIRGCELAIESHIYSLFWRLAYPEVEPKPWVWVVPEVMQTLDDKISKSNPAARGYYCADLKLDPLKAIVGLTANQMEPTVVSGWMQDYLMGTAEECIAGLRHWITLAIPNPRPRAITMEDVARWT